MASYGDEQGAISVKGVQTAVLVIGAGIGGIKASLELAESGIEVYLCDRRPYIGGTLTQLDRWFPDDHCGLCRVLLPFPLARASQYCLRQGLSHPNVEELPLTTVEKLEGEADNFSVTLSTQPFGIKPGLCNGCGQCEQVCPIEVDDEFDHGLKRCKAVHPRHPLGAAAKYVIDYQRCTRCGACVEHCPTGAIELSLKPQQREIKVGAIILSTGFEEFDPLSATQYGYRRFPNVITGIELERLLSGTRPTNGELLRPGDRKVPQSVAFLQCVGSRTWERDYCSSACCLTALKEAMMIKQKYPHIEIYFFFTELRAFSKGGYRYYEKAAALGIKFMRCRIPRVGQNFQNKNLVLTLNASPGRITTQEFELVVLSAGQNPSSQFEELSRVLGLRLNKWGFCETAELAPVESDKKGIYVCGSLSGPKDVADTVTEATAAAGQALALLAPIERPAPETKLTIPQEPRVAIYLCHCAGQISQTVNLRETVEFSRQLPGVVCAQEVDFLCQPEVLAKVRSEAGEAQANRIVLAACSDHTLAKSNGGVPIELVNLREELAWVHRDSSEQATDKAKRLLAMAIEKLRLEEDWPSLSYAVTPRVVVIGGGLAGMVAALSVAERGFEVELVEKSGALGGNLKRLDTLLAGSSALALLQELSCQVETQPLVHLWEKTEVTEVAGCAGDFKVALKQSGSEAHIIDTGAIIVATGAEELKPTDYLYGQANEVLTQLEMEEKLARGEIKSEELKSVAMIQCVGSRDSQRPYCSRVCCSQALKNALNLRQRNPGLQVTIFYRDMMAYGLKEEYYTKCREQGIEFVRYELSQKPVVEFKEGKLEIHASEPVLGGELILKPDLLVLSPAIVPGDNARLASLLGVELDQDSFFQEAGMKFRPVDFLKEGIYVCGLAHSPRHVSETIVQAQAAAAKAVQLLSRRKLISAEMTSAVNERWCTGCEVCVKVCPFEARYKSLNKRAVQVREALCHGCGACAAACPSGAAKLRWLSGKQVVSMLDIAI